MAFSFQHGARPLAGYTIERGVGRGGFGEVYYARSDGGKEVALKYLRDNPQVELRGVHHCLNLKSPYLVGIHDIKQSVNGDYFVIMEYVSGPSLRDLLIAEPNGLGPQKAAYFLREICKGLSYLHDRGIVHRDMKPGNIFYEDGFVKIGDYGLAKIMAASQHSGQTMSVGTVHYMAPEVGSGNYDRTIDIYAMGVMLYEMLLGRVPYSGATMGEVLMKHLTAQPIVDELPEPFPHVIRKALAKDPKDRYQTAEEMMAAVFSVEEVTRSVAGMDSLGLTRMAAAVATKVKAGGGHHGGGVATGSSNTAAYTPDRIPPLPPPMIQRGAHTDDRVAKRRTKKQANDEFFGFTDGTAFPQRYRLTAGLLGVFLGPFGVHRFYTGHNQIAFYQLIVTFVTGGLGGLWGFFEGVQILANGDFRDSLGRPLLARPQRPAAVRSMFARLAWGAGGVLAMMATLGFAGAATFAPAEYEPVGWRVDGQSYFFNMFHLMYFIASATLGLALFSIWKASHRGGLALYRATVRPALMCGCLSAIGIALTSEIFLFVGKAQIIPIGFIFLAGIAGLFLWMLRGPERSPAPDDLYWNRAWTNVFAVLGVGCLIGAFALYNTDGGVFYEGKHHHASRARPIFSSVQVNETDYVRSSSGGYESKKVTREYRTPNAMYNHVPIAAGLLLLTAVGAFNEARHRRRLVRCGLESVERTA